MAHTFIKPEIITSTALGILEQELTIANLVWTDAGFNFVGAQGDTITVRLPGKTTANEAALRFDRASDISLSNITEDSTTVALNKHLYSAVALTDEELTLDIADFGTQVLRPQVRAVAETIDLGLTTMITGATYKTTVAVSLSTAGDDDAARGTKILNAIVDMRAALNKENVPTEGRSLLIGPDVEAMLLKANLLRDASQAGDSTALRNATVGRLAGFDVVVSNRITDKSMYAFIKSAFVLANQAPAVPSGAAFAASQSFNGLAMRWVRDYDPMKLMDRSVVSIFTGYNVMKDTPAAGGAKALVRGVKATVTEVA